MARFDRDIVDEAPRDSRVGPLERDLYLRPLLPKDFKTYFDGNGTRLAIIDRNAVEERSGTVRYVFSWAKGEDDGTNTQIDAASERAEFCGDVSAPRIEDRAASIYLADPKFRDSGRFFCRAQDKAGNLSAEYISSVVSGGGDVDARIPGDVTHLQISESGVTGIDGMLYSELSVSCRAPIPKTSFAGPQLFLQHYTEKGSVQQGYFHRYDGPANGAMNFKVPYPIPRRKGPSLSVIDGATNATAASGFLAIAQIGDVLELQGRRRTLTAVTDTTISFADPWDLPSVTTTDYSIIPKVTIYAVSISKGGTHRDDWENSPSVALVMDGELSTPNAPTTVTATALGNGVLITWDQVASSSLARYNVYRSSGTGTDAGMAFAPPRPSTGTILIDRVPVNPNLKGGSLNVTMQTTDTQFTDYEKETGASFRWYVTVTNTRGDESSATSVTASCRPAAPPDVDPSVPGRVPIRNLLYNAWIAGTAGNQVLANDTSQDVNYGGLVVVGTHEPGRPYHAASGQVDGTGRFVGYTRWESNDGVPSAGASGSVRFQNGDEVHMDAPGAGKSWFFYLGIGAWEHATAAHRKIQPGEPYILSVWAMHNGVTPNGTFYAYIEQMNNGSKLGDAYRRYRNSSSDLVTDSSPLSIACSSLTADPQRFFAIFVMNPSLTPTRQIHVNFAHANSTTGVVVVKKVMLSGPGEELIAWTADMGNTEYSAPVPTRPVGEIGDAGSGRHGGARVITP